MQFLLEQTYIISTVENPIIVIIGTKQDKISSESPRTISESVVNQFINDNGLYYYEISSKSGQSVNYIFEDLGEFFLLMCWSLLIRQGRKLLVNTMRERGGLPPLWIPDEENLNCSNCQTLFSLVVRRHHCRNCGQIFCSSCSSKSIKIERIGHIQSVRVCDNCYTLISLELANSWLCTNFMKIIEISMSIFPYRKNKLANLRKDHS